MSNPLYCKLVHIELHVSAIIKIGASRSNAENSGQGSVAISIVDVITQNNITQTLTVMSAGSLSRSAVLYSNSIFLI